MSAGEYTKAVEQAYQPSGAPRCTFEVIETPSADERVVRIRRQFSGDAVIRLYRGQPFNIAQLKHPLHFMAPSDPELEAIAAHLRVVLWPYAIDVLEAPSADTPDEWQVCIRRLSGDVIVRLHRTEQFTHADPEIEVIAAELRRTFWP